MKTLLSRTILTGLLLLFAFPLFLVSTSLFAQSGPVNLDFEEGSPGLLPPGWYLGGSPYSAYSAYLTTLNPISGQMCAVLSRDSTAEQNDFGHLSQEISVIPFRGKHVRFRAAVRASVSGYGNEARLWLRVDHSDEQIGFFDNMSFRPITTPEWNYYEIIGPVAADATQIFLGLILTGSGEAWIDDCSLEIITEGDPEPPHPLTLRGLENVTAFTRLIGYIRHFHPSDEAAAVTNWDPFAAEGIRAVESAGDAAELASILETLFHPIAPTLSVFPTGAHPTIVQAPPPLNPSGIVQVVTWDHLGFGTASSRNIYRSARKYTNAPDGEIPEELSAYREPYQSDLGGGVSCSFPLAVFADSSGTWPPGTKLGPTMYAYSVQDRATRLAAVALAWNVFQHFYPYFDVVDTDWPAALTAALTSAATDTDETEFLDTLRRLVVALHDGHGHVYNLRIPAPAYGPPFTWDWIEGNLVITRVLSEGQSLAPGDVVLSINGKPAADALAEVESLISGATPQWIRYLGLRELYLGNQGEYMTLQIEPWASPGTQTQVTVMHDTPLSSIQESRPAKIAELKPGICYVDIDRISDDDFLSALPQLAQAEGIVFDMRGYPRNLRNWYQFFSHITEQPVTSAWWNSPIVRFPDRKELTFLENRWPNILPQDPFLEGKKAFITDGRAISYAESLMGIVEHYGLAEIVGGPTAGTNGDTNLFLIAGNYLIYWTGLKVLKHDGSQHHGVGIHPTVPAGRTRAGAAAGVDELLQRAIQIVSPASVLEMQLPDGGANTALTYGSGSSLQVGYAIATVNSGIPMGLLFLALDKIPS